MIFKIMMTMAMIIDKIMMLRMMMKMAMMLSMSMSIDDGNDVNTKYYNRFTCC